ncbi:MAG TPA: o-succinylbenzoate synthase [Armatimonadota bacterium]|jgi:O-succinylbenzoate synthase
MRIDAIALYRVAMPLVYPFATAYGSDDAIESVLVRLTSGGVEGWGESSPMRNPHYSPEWAAGIFLLLREVLAPRLLGEEIATGAELQARLGAVKGNFFAKAALDTAWWDLHARLRGEPLWQTLGGGSPTVTVGADFGVMDTLDMLVRAIGTAVDAGFQRVKLKFRPGWDLEMVRTVRAAFPDTVFHVDCNSGYRLADLPIFQQLDRYNLAMIEQPLMYDDLLDTAALQREIATPICLDESITSVDKARQAIEIGACRWVNIKPGRVGGLTPALAIHNLCADAGIPCWIGGMLESAVGASHCLALATLPNIKYPSDVFPSSRFYREDLATPEIALSSPSHITASSAPGIGVEPHPERLAACTVENAVVNG